MPTNLRHEPRPHRQLSGFSLVETVIAVFIVGMIVIGGLAGLGQANLMSEKGREQVLADFYLRAEIEALRSLSWNEIEARTTAIQAHKQSSEDPYSTLLTQDAATLAKAQMSAEIKAARLNANGERGRHIYHITMAWNDRATADNEETRVLVVTEGGMSAR